RREDALPPQNYLPRNLQVAGRTTDLVHRTVPLPEPPRQRNSRYGPAAGPRSWRDSEGPLSGSRLVGPGRRSLTSQSKGRLLIRRPLRPQGSLSGRGFSTRLDCWRGHCDTDDDCRLTSGLSEARKTTLRRGEGTH